MYDGGSESGGELDAQIVVDGDICGEDDDLLDLLDAQTKAELMEKALAVQAELQRYAKIEYPLDLLLQLVAIGEIHSESYEDNSGKPVRCGFVIETDQPLKAVDIIIKSDNSAIAVGALTSATENFVVKAEKPNGHGLRIPDLIGVMSRSLAPNDSSSIPVTSSDIPLDQLRSNQLQLGHGFYATGAGVTTGAVNQALRERHDEMVALGLLSAGEEEVAGATHTTLNTAHNGASQNSKGPDGICLSQTAIELVAHTGREIKNVGSAEAPKFGGRWGMTGIVGASKHQILRYDGGNARVLLALTGAQTTKDGYMNLAKVQAALRPFADLHIQPDGKIVGQRESGTVVNGAEIFGRSAVQLVSDRKYGATKRAVREHASHVAEYLDMTESNMAILLMARTPSRTFEEFSDDHNGPLAALRPLVEQGILADFDDADMQPLITSFRWAPKKPAGGAEALWTETREALPGIAREKPGKLRREGLQADTDSTDVDLSLDPAVDLLIPKDELWRAHYELLRPWEGLVSGACELRKEFAGKGGRVEISEYGHSLAGRVNPHTRKIVSAKDPFVFAELQARNKGLNHELGERIRAVPDRVKYEGVIEERGEVGVQIRIGDEVHVFPLGSDVIHRGGGILECTIRGEERVIHPGTQLAKVKPGEKGPVTQEALDMMSPEQLGSLCDELKGAHPALTRQMLPALRKKVDLHVARGQEVMA